jgi:hypothetical protein
VKKLSILVIYALALSLWSTAPKAHDDETRNFIIMKTPYRHLIASPLPTKAPGDVDIELLIVESSMTREPNLGPTMQWHLSGVILALIEEDAFSAEQYMKGFVRSTKNSQIPLDINEVIQWVIRQSYLETNRDLSYLASKVKYFNDLKKTIRDEQLEVERIRDLENCIPGGTAGNICTDSEALFLALASQLQTTSNDAQLAHIDIQNALQTRTQYLTLVSNMTKLMHDTAMSVIRNVK